MSTIPLYRLHFPFCLHFYDFTSFNPHFPCFTKQNCTLLRLFIQICALGYSDWVLYIHSPSHTTLPYGLCDILSKIQQNTLEYKYLHVSSLEIQIRSPLSNQRQNSYIFVSSLYSAFISVHQRPRRLPQRPRVDLSRISSKLSYLHYLSTYVAIHRVPWLLSSARTRTRTLLSQRSLPVLLVLCFGTASDAPTHHFGAHREGF